MIQIKEKQKCYGCSACLNTCPNSCISMKYDEEGFYYPIVNKEKCVECHICENVCPKNKPLDSKVTSYAAYSKNNFTRKGSSSGGVFSVLAEYVLDRNGVVVGAAFTDNMQLRHIAVEKKEDIYKLQGSKYIQSEIGYIYRKVKNLLDDGILVLFTGTPCQISAIHSFLKKEYDNLICQDIACMGVPAPMMWELYKKEQEKKMHGNMVDFFFRDKKTGWKNYSVTGVYGDKIKSKYAYDDAYMRAFSSKLWLRPSCYVCSFKGIERDADITLADFWGIEHIYPEIDDDKGMSLIMLHTKKGVELLNNVKEQLWMKEIKLEDALKYNPAITKSAEKKTERESFITDAQKGKFSKISKKYCGITFGLNIKIKIYRFLRKYNCFF